MNQELRNERGLMIEVLKNSRLEIITQLQSEIDRKNSMAARLKDMEQNLSSAKENCQRWADKLALVDKTIANLEKLLLDNAPATSEPKPALAKPEEKPQGYVVYNVDAKHPYRLSNQAIAAIIQLSKDQETITNDDIRSIISLAGEAHANSRLHAYQRYLKSIGKLESAGFGLFRRRVVPILRDSNGNPAGLPVPKAKGAE